MNTDALTAFASGRKSSKKAKVWRPPAPEDFVLADDTLRYVLAVDQSISGCAAVLLAAHRQPSGPSLSVMVAQKFATTPVEAGGYEETLQRAQELYGRLAAWITQQVVPRIRTDVEVVHEQPPVGGGRVIRPESSLLAALALRIVAETFAFPVQRMVAPQTHKGFICGNRSADKREHHAALKRVAADLRVSGMELVTNEDLRDALSIGLTHLAREP